MDSNSKTNDGRTRNQWIANSKPMDNELETDGGKNEGRGGEEGKAASDGRWQTELR